MMEYILLLEKAERLKAALDNTKIAYYELRKENEELKTAFGLVQTAANIFKKLYEEKGRE